MAQPTSPHARESATISDTSRSPRIEPAALVAGWPLSAALAGFGAVATAAAEDGVAAAGVDARTDDPLLGRSPPTLALALGESSVEAGADAAHPWTSAELDSTSV